MMNKKLLILIVVSVGIFLLLIIVGIYLVLTKDKPKETPQTNGQTAATTPKQTPTPEKTTTPPTTAPSPSPAPISGGNPPSPPTTPPKKPWFKLELTSATQSGAELQIRADVHGTTTGTCELSLTRAGAPSIKRTVEIGSDKFKTYCFGFLIPVEEVYTGGIWEVKMIAKVGDVTSEPIITKIEVTR